MRGFIPPVNSSGTNAEATGTEIGTGIARGSTILTAERGGAFSTTTGT
jgi:hypothetical protein